MRQTAVMFGPQKALVGVLTEPDVVRPGAPIMLLFNSGLLPRQGPHRMNVRIARDLTSIGIASFRFDLSGLGDSQSVGSESGSLAQALRDVQSAMDWLEHTRGAKRFLVFGVCSGAVVNFDLAQLDDRVAGISMFDGYWYRSRWTKIVRHFKMARAKGLQNALAAAARRILTRPTAPEPDAALAPALTEYHDNPPIESYVASMQRIVDRGIDAQIVYSGSLIDMYSYAAQYRHVFGSYPFYRKVQCLYEPEMDHTLTTAQAQQRLLDIIRAWGRSHLSNAGSQ